VFQFAGRIVADTRHETYLRFYEKKRHVFGTHECIRAGLIWHTIEFIKAIVSSLDPNYDFVDALLPNLANDEVILCGNATKCIATYQTARLKNDQRLISNSGSASRRYDLPVAIGAAVARKGKRVILPNKGGYLSMRTSQDSFSDRRIGEGERCISFPDVVKLAAEYGLPARRIGPQGCCEAIRDAIASDGPIVCEVMLDPEQRFEPRLSSLSLPDGRMVSARLEDMVPFLDREELRSNLLVPLAEN
jgi:acetolactate synthase-1/2/3 large subunit